MDDLNRCPRCKTRRDHPEAPCGSCDYDPTPAPADDRALDAWERKIGAGPEAPEAPIELPEDPDAATLDAWEAHREREAAGEPE